MEVFHKFYKRLFPLAEKEIKSRDFPSDVAATLIGIARQMVIEATQVYTRDLMNDKYNLKIDISDWHCIPTEEEMEIDPSPTFPTPSTSCEICGISFPTELCHIIPRHQGGSNGYSNLITLCRNHHVHFDSALLSKEEWSLLTWKDKDPRSRYYAETVRYCNQLVFWKYGDSEIAGDCPNQDDFEGLREATPIQYPSQELIDEYKPDVLKLIRDNPGILQMNIKKHYLPDYENVVGYALFQLRLTGTIRREPKGRSFELFIYEENL